MEATPKLDVIPAIDLLGGTVVRLLKGDFDRVTEYVNDPETLARRYVDSGAGRLHVVDLDGARTGDPVNLPIIERLADCGLEVQAGGGIRDKNRLQNLFAAGVTRAVIGSVAVERRADVADWIDTFGADRIIVAVDVRLNDQGEPELLTHGWTEGTGQSMWPLVDYYLARGAREFLCTDIARDGTLEGPNTDLYTACSRRFPDAEFIASGGVSGIEDLYALQTAGARRVVTGKALLDGRLTIEEIRQFSQDA